MQTKVTGIALALSFSALAVAAYAITRGHSDPSAFEGRLDTLDARLARMEQAAAARERETEDEPTLVGLGLGPRGSAPRRADGTADTMAAATADPAAVSSGGEAEEQIREMIDEAVEKKAAQIQHMQNKKPPIDLFAKTLELTSAQRQAVEREAVRGQREIQAILEIPASDGTNFLDELVEVMADGMAHPGENPGRGMKLFGRLMSEEIPGSSDTYAARVELVKNTVRETFRREMTKEQYAVFEAWQMDPTEIQGIETSPWKDVERRVIERAKELGAEIPGDDG